LRAVGRAAAVVVDPNNGDILAMVSVPSFDPNTFIPSIKAKDWQTLRKDEANPLVNRAISAFPPGSTFKLITSLAGLRKNLSKARFTCYGGVSYGDHYFHCWVSEKGGQHGTLGLTDAIKVSCDAFFYQYGNAAGIDSIDVTGKMLGLGEESGTQLAGEQVGVLPGPEWMQVQHPQERWSQAYTANVSIGQGYDLVTPLQLAMAYTAAANGGVCYYPRLVDKVLNQDGSPVLDENGKIAVPKTPRVRTDLRNEFTPDQIELVRKGLWKVVNEDGGTGSAARLKAWQVAGKTGTAQATDHGHKDTIAWFACFAPFDRPKYVVAVMVQGGEHGGGVAGPVATRIMERTLALDEGKFDMPVAWLAPAHKANPFQIIKSVDYRGAGGNLGSDEENADASQNADAQMANAGAAPDVEPEADAQGTVRRARLPRAVPVAAPARPRNFFERLFGVRHQPAPTPPPARRSGTR
jgi:penicillin-binding protein 2